VRSSNEKSIGLRKFFLGGVIGGMLATIMLFFGTDLLGYPFPPLAIFQLLIAPVPGSIQSVVVETFREYAKYSAFVFSSAIYVFLYGVIGILLGAIVNSPRDASTISDGAESSIAISKCLLSDLIDIWLDNFNCPHSRSECHLLEDSIALYRVGAG
jgi:hypothetical protein